MQTKYAALARQIRYKYGTQAAFAKHVGMNPATMSKKMNGITSFTTDEIEKICDALNISYKRVPFYFFENNVVKTQQKED